LLSSAIVVIAAVTLGTLGGRSLKKGLKRLGAG
jgi:hypothetical protein